MSTPNYLPRAYKALMGWLLNFTSYLDTNRQRFGIAEVEIADLTAKYEAYRLSHEKADSPNAGKADRLDREEKALCSRRWRLMMSGRNKICIRMKLPCNC